MTASEPPDRTASNKEDGLAEARAEALSAYVTWPEGRPLAQRSGRRTAIRSGYLVWLGDRWPVDDAAADKSLLMAQISICRSSASAENGDAPLSRLRQLLGEPGRETRMGAGGTAAGADGCGY